MFILDESFWEVQNTDRKDRGIFAKKDIPGGTVIGDYLGKIVHPDNEPDDEKLYTMYYSDNASIVSDPKEIGLHIINHSCMPNCDSHTYKNRILYFAARKIFKGEELTISYDLGPPDEDCNPCTHACFCETPLCRGSWHTSEESMEVWKEMYKGDYDEVMTAPPPVPYGEDLPLLLDYPTIVEDQPFYNLYANTNKPPVISEEQVLPSTQQIRQRIREEGVPIYFKHINLCISGVTRDLMLALPPKNET